MNKNDPVGITENMDWKVIVGDSGICRTIAKYLIFIIWKYQNERRKKGGLKKNFKKWLLQFPQIWPKKELKIKICETGWTFVSDNPKKLQETL